MALIEAKIFGREDRIRRVRHSLIEERDPLRGIRYFHKIMNAWLGTVREFYDVCSSLTLSVSAIVETGCGQTLQVTTALSCCSFPQQNTDNLLE
jgi:hypothetical protein